MRREEAELVDRYVGSVLEGLPAALRELVEEVPIVLLDEPDEAMLRDLGIDPQDQDARFEICGLHTGVSMTEESVEAPSELPTVIHLFRLALLELARTDDGRVDHETLEREVRITILHELGHHFGLDEDDLDSLGYA